MPELTWPGKRAEPDEPEPPRPLRSLELVSPLSPADGPADPGPPVGAPPWRDRLIRGDRRAVLLALLPELAGQVQLAYLDPPFDTGAAYAARVALAPDAAAPAPLGPPRRIERPAFRDAWGPGPDAYLQWLYETIVLLHRALAARGSLFVHLDWRAAHLARCLLDEVFGPSGFRNEIVWAYGRRGRGGKATSQQFPRNHDVILWYGCSAATTYHPQRVVRRVPVAAAGQAGFRRDADGRWFKTAPRGNYTDDSLARLTAAGRIHQTAGGQPRVKYYLREERDASGEWVVEESLLGDVWSDVPDGMHLPAAERSGYPTQKPAALLERLILAASDPGDLVLDCCCGSGTTAVAAAGLGRRWVAADHGRLAVQTARRRLLASPGGRPFLVQEIPELKQAPGPPAPTPAEPPGGELQATLSLAGRRATLTLTGYAPAAGPDAPPGAAAGDWQRWLDGWAVDWDYRGDLFRGEWRLRPPGRRGELPIVAAHVYDAGELGEPGGSDGPGGQPERGRSVIRVTERAPGGAVGVGGDGEAAPATEEVAGAAAEGVVARVVVRVVVRVKAVDVLGGEATWERAVDLSKVARK